MKSHVRSYICVENNPAAVIRPADRSTSGPSQH